ncbi:hypothetical protein Q8A67_018059 [Cirrhinus molitorella]|uniref:Uncharacterized protein n=1 Tax=Cirrhinus molitorella TaxID=172907 RepID=A0AA88PFH0_9TELE|nr:hypothetical protein Q8A67_018059 [Cirrhinus molitorella]
MSLVLSDFTHLILKCTTENNEHLQNCKSDSCKWNMNLTDCDTLRLQCTDTQNNNRKSVCNSLEDCGMSNSTEFKQKLLGHIQCDFKKGIIECLSRVLCKDVEFLEHMCKTEYCGMKHINSENTCKFSHSIKKCIHENEIFPIKGDLNCTMTTGNIEDNYPWGPEKYNPACPSRPDETNDGYKNATITLALFCGLFFLVCIILIGMVWKMKTRRQGPEVHEEHNKAERVELNDHGRDDRVNNKEDAANEEN